MIQQLWFCLWLSKNTQICFLIYNFSQIIKKKKTSKHLEFKEIWNLIQTDTLSYDDLVIEYIR